MNFIENLGTLALGIRLKRLSDQLMQDGIRIYRTSGIEFEAKWFPVLYYLNAVGPTSVTDLARTLGVSHPAVIKISQELIAANLLAVYRVVSDKRKRVLALTTMGKQKIRELEPVSKAIQNVSQALLEEADSELLTDLSRLERALRKRSFQQRFLEYYRAADQT